MYNKRLILLLLALLWATTGTRLAAAEAASEPQVVAAASVHLPQWRDIGMFDLLAAPPTAVAAPPTTLRPAHHLPALTPAAAPMLGRRVAAASVTALASRSCCKPGYIYLIRCLRL